jgi:hypothetical protein
MKIKSFAALALSSLLLLSGCVDNQALDIYEQTILSLESELLLTKTINEELTNTIIDLELEVQNSLIINESLMINNTELTEQVYDLEVVLGIHSDVPNELRDLAIISFYSIKDATTILLYDSNDLLFKRIDRCNLVVNDENDLAKCISTMTTYGYENVAPSGQVLSPTVMNSYIQFYMYNDGLYYLSPVNMIPYNEEIMRLQGSRINKANW